MSQLDLGMKPPMMALTAELIAKPHSFRQAIIMTADIAGFDSVNGAAAMGVPQETFSRFKTDKKLGLNPDRFESFMDNCGNELALHHLALRRGYFLVERETETQRLLRIEREKREEVEAENRVLRSVISGRPA
jgi:hypothetical protein